jgi:hypothetical protein
LSTTWPVTAYVEVAVGTAWWSGTITGGDTNGTLLIYNCGAPSGQVLLWNPTSNTWFADIQGFGGNSTYHCVAEYSPVHNVAIFGGGNDNPRKVWRLNSNRTVTVLPDAPVDLGVQHANLSVDPVTGHFLVMGYGQLWQLDPRGSGSWTQQNGSRTPPSAVGNPGSPDLDSVISAPISNYGVVAYVTCRTKSCNMYLYKHSGSAQTTFDFSISNAGNQRVTVGQNAANTITLGTVSGTPQSVSLSASGLPPAVTASFAPTSCTPNCTSTLTLSTSASTPTGTSTITVTGTAGALTRTTTFTLTVAASGGWVTAFQLTSGVTGTLPFTLGLGFRKGDIAGVPVINVGTSQVIVKSRWSDNSVKHAIASGSVALTAGTPLVLQVSSAASGPSGTNLTAADIQARNPHASVQLGAIGTVNLSSLLATPFRTWISGPEMVEAHYRSAVGADPTLVVWFYVRLYKDGQIWIRAVVENGYLDVTTSDKTYVPTVTVAGAVVYNNDGAALTHYAHTRWTAEGWVGNDPQITSKVDTAYLIDTKLVPNYWKRNPSASVLSALYQDYSPMQNGGWTADMGNTGFQSQIGLLPLWDALFVTSGGDVRAYKSVIANAKALNSYPIVWNDSATKLPTTPSGRPTWTVAGNNAGGATNYGAGTLTWDVAHHGSGGYLAYLITGDYYFLETMEDQSSMCYLINTSGHSFDPANGLGTLRLLKGQTRAAAWCQRTIGQLAAIAPADSISNDYRVLLANNGAYWNSVAQTSGQNLIGYLYSYEIGEYGPGAVAPWQQHFFVQTYGYVSDLEPFTTMTTWNAVRDYLYTSVSGILGPTGSSNYCYTGASNYTIVVSSASSSDPTTWFNSWGQVYQSTFGAANTNCETTLLGASGGDPAAAATGYWGNLLPAIAYAVDHGATGASEAWTRLSGASNWSTVANSGFDDTPIWGIVPRNSGNTGTGNPLPLSIANNVASDITRNAVTITWTTSQPADSQVEYGTTTSYGGQTTIDTALVTSHSQIISGLSAGTTYNYRIKSRDASGTLATSENLTFTTDSSVVGGNAFDFSVSVAASGSVTAGKSVSFEIGVSLISGSSTPVSLSVLDVTSGVSVALSQTSCTPTCTSIMTVTSSESMNPGLYKITVKGTSGLLSHTTSLDLSIVAPGGSADSLTTGLIGYWSFDEGAGLSTYDSSGNGNSGILINSPVWTSGRVGNALSFNATDNGNDDDDPRVLIGKAFDVPQGPFTLTAWVNPVSFTDWRAIFSKRDHYSASTMRFDVGFAQNSGQVYLTTAQDFLFFDVVPQANVWTHLAVVASSTDTKLYVNGVLRQTLQPVTLGTGATANAVIGGTGEGPGGDNDPFSGVIDEVRIYNRAVSSTEVQKIYSITTSAP